MAIQVEVKSVTPIEQNEGDGNTFIAYATARVVVEHLLKTTPAFNVTMFRRLDTDDGYKVAQSAMGVIHARCNAIGIFDPELLQEVVEAINNAITQAE